MPFGTFPKIHPFWCLHLSLMTMMMTTLVMKINEERPDCGSTKVESDCSGKDFMMMILSLLNDNDQDDDNKNDEDDNDDNDDNGDNDDICEYHRGAAED